MFPYEPRWVYGQRDDVTGIPKCCVNRMIYWLVVDLPLVGNILLIMVNDDGYYMVNDGYYITWLVVDLPL